MREVIFTCDRCGCTIENDGGHRYSMPRMSFEIAKNKDGVALIGFQRLVAIDTDLCNNCANIIAALMPEVSND